MNEYIPGWVFLLFGLGSPVQEFINRWVPERLRPVLLWGVAFGIVLAVVLITPLDWDAFNLQLALVYAALTSGWAMSNLVKPPLRPSAVAVRSVLIMGAVVGLALAARAAWAQVDSLGAGVPIPVPDLQATSDTIFPGMRSFIVAQILAFVGATLTRWFGRAREGSLRAR
jgi:hypothetical protein